MRSIPATKPVFASCPNVMHPRLLMIVLLSLFLLPAQPGLAQQSLIGEFNKVVDFLPPPPNAAAITKAGYFNLNKNTGAPNINIPIYSVKGKYLSMV